MLNNSHISKQLSGAGVPAGSGLIVLVVNIVLLLRKQGWR
jgi:hypothetical protein